MMTYNQLATQFLSSSTIAIARQVLTKLRLQAASHAKCVASGSPRKLGGVKGKGEREKMFIPLTFNL
jgi:hypothetical protein